MHNPTKTVTSIKLRKVLGGLLSLMVMAVAGRLPAQTAFLETFSSNTLGSRLQVIQGYADPSNGNVRLELANNATSTVGTIATNYHTVDFTAEVTVTMPNTLAGSYFGLGRGSSTPDPGDNYGNPASGPVVYIRHFMNPGVHTNNNLTIGTNNQFNGGLTPGGGMGEILNLNGVGPGATTYKLKFTYTGGIVRFYVNGVAFGPAVNVSAYNFTGHGRIFFGGDASVTCDDLTVTFADSDGDDYPDDVDAFPWDPTEWTDTDNDGVGDNADAFPIVPTESKDTDGDGVGDNADVFPTNPSESADTDGDGVGNNADAFPLNPSESTDTDGDGVGDNSDVSVNSDVRPTLIINGVDTMVANQVFADGSTLADLIAQAAQVSGPASFSSAVTQLTNQLKDAGVITGKEKGAIVSAAAKKPGK